MPDICVSPRYTVRTRLTSAGSTEGVWLAEDAALDSRQVVLKKILVPGRVQEDSSRLLGMCDAFLSLSHPGLARPLRFCPGHERGSLWLASEHVPGEPFLPTIRSLPHDTLLSVLSQFCSVLYYLHSRGYGHLDLHPGNVLLVPPRAENEDWTLKIIDLPLLPLSVLSEHRELLRFHPGFSAPEVLAGDPFDNRADLYSLGSLFYTAFVGEQPPKTPARGEPAESSPLNDSLHTTLLIPAYLVTIIRSLLECRVEKRFSSAYFLFEDINASLRAHQLPPLPNPAPDSISRNVPLIPTTALDSSIAFLESWLQSSPPQSTLSLVVRGMPGAGCTRLTRALGLHLTLRGCQEMVLQPRANAEILGWTDSVLLPSNERLHPSQPCYIIGNTESPAARGDIAHLASRLESSVVLLSAHDAGFTTAPPPTPSSPADDATIHLSPLTDPQCALLIDRILHPNNIPDDVKTALARKALNLPGLLSHLLKDHVNAGELRRHGPLWETTAGFSPARPIPAEAADPFRPAFESLPQLDFDLLTLLSMARGPTPLSVLTEVLSAPTSTVARSLDALEQQGLVEHDAQNASLKSFTVAQLLAHVQDRERRAALARRALSLLPAKATQQPSPLDALLASYAVHAHSVEDVLHYALRASTHFESVNRIDEALVFCEYAVRAIEDHDAVSQIPVLARCLELLDRIGDKERFEWIATRLQRLLPQRPSKEHIHLYHLLAKHFSDCMEFEPIHALRWKGHCHCERSRSDRRDIQLPHRTRSE